MNILLKKIEDSGKGMARRCPVESENSGKGKKRHTFILNVACVFARVLCKHLNNRIYYY